MQAKFKYLIFDWDGTLMDSSSKIVSCMQLAAKQSSLMIPTEEEIKNIIGISLIPAIERLFGVDCYLAESIADRYKQAFINLDKTPSPLFRDATNTLDYLSRYAKLAVATGKARRGLERAWRVTNTKQYFICSRCADEAESKPSPDMLLQIVKEWNVEPNQALMIGDTTYDMQMAESIDMPSVAVSFGVHSVEALKKHGPIEIIDSLIELKKYVSH